MPTSTTSRRARARLLAAALAMGATLSLSGCGDMEGVDQQAVDDLFRQAEDALEQAEDALKDAQEAAEDPEAQAEREAAAKEAQKWPTKPASPAVEPEWSATSNHGEWAAEDAIYPDEAYDDLVDHYTDHYGEPPREYPGFVEWNTGEAGNVTSTRITPSGDQVGVTTIWPKP